jgi:hypothetical protein
MILDDMQKARVAMWIEEGAKLADIQKRLEAEFGIRISYMDARFLVDDLKLTPKDPEPAKTEASVLDAGAKGVAPPADPMMPTAAGGVSVVLDQLMRPGSLVSGKVTFSDGKTAEWHLDQMGRLAIVAGETGYKPSAADVKAFQTELQKQLEKGGF